MRIRISITCIIVLNLLFSSCHRQLLDEWYYDKVSIPIHIDWSKSNVNPQNVSMLFFNKYNGNLVTTHYFENNSRTIQSYVDLGEGTYTVVVFNELPNQIKNVSINTNTTYNDLHAQGEKATSVSLPIEGETYYGQPSALASVIVDELEIDADMVYYLKEMRDSIALWPPYEHPITALMGLVPMRNLSLFKANIHIDGLVYARMPALITLQNVSGSYHFAQDKYGLTPVSYQVNDTQRQYDANSKVNGTLSTQFNLYGVIGGRATVEQQPADSPIMLTINIQQVDKERTIITRQYDITKLITFTKLSDGTILIELNLTDTDPLPEVKPEGGDGESGFDTTLEDWEVIEVPINN